MNLQNHVFPESVLLELNDMREYSLLKFYNVSLKSKFSNISHVVPIGLTVDCWVRAYLQTQKR